MRESWRKQNFKTWKIKIKTWLSLWPLACSVPLTHLDWEPKWGRETGSKDNWLNLERPGGSFSLWKSLLMGLFHWLGTPENDLKAFCIPYINYTVWGKHLTVKTQRAHGWASFWFVQFQSVFMNLFGSFFSHHFNLFECFHLFKLLLHHQCYHSCHVALIFYDIIFCISFI